MHWSIKSDALSEEVNLWRRRFFYMFRKSIPLLLLPLSLGFFSCSKQQPEACISIHQRATTFHLNEEVQFQAGCSKNAEAYQWSIGKPGEYQTFHTSSVQLKFAEIGTYEVKLRVGNNQESDVVSLMVQVIDPEAGE